MIPHNENEVVKEFRAIKEEYAYNPDVMCLDDDRVRKIKYIIDNRLDAVDRTIILRTQIVSPSGRWPRKWGCPTPPSALG